jgi:hypothetical protein
MPLLDHFHAPLFPLFHWESFHSHWASTLTNELNAGLLPPHFIAAPHVKMGMEVEIDVGTLELFSADTENGGLATRTYAPPQPAITLPVDFTNLDLFEILIRPEGSARLAAAIEFVSPGNKDRPANRRALAIKCASYLQQGASVLLVDIVTLRTSPLHAEIVTLLSGAATNPTPFGPLCTVAYRTVASKERGVSLQVWPETLELGKSLPEMPLWLTADCVVPVNLEQSYTQTCATLRIRAG